MWWLMSLIGCVTANLWGNPLPLRSYRWTIMECTPTQEWAGQTDLESLHALWAPATSETDKRKCERLFRCGSRRQDFHPAASRRSIPGSFSACALPTSPVSDSAFPLRISTDRLLFCCSSTILFCSSSWCEGTAQLSIVRDFPSACTRVSCGSVGCLPHTWPSAAAAGPPPSQSRLHLTSDWCFPSPLPARTASKQPLFIFYSCCAELPWRHNSQPIPLTELLLC